MFIYAVGVPEVARVLHRLSQLENKAQQLLAQQAQVAVRT
jgi:hypothetical protein